MQHPAATLDVAAVAALRDETVDYRHKALPPALWGGTVAEVIDRAPRLSDLPTPVLSLDRSALDHNRDLLAGWCAERGLALAPHGKTTMAPQLWAEQLAAGSWAITVANLAQLGVALAFGVSRVMVANTIVSPLALRWIADRLAADPDLEVLVWADDVRSVALMHEALAAHGAPGAPGATRPLPVLVEAGAAGGRTGARDESAALAVAAAVAESPYLELAGVCGYEGALAHTDDAESLQVVHSYVDRLAALHACTGDLVPSHRTPVVTAGGSAYFEQVADALAPLATSARVVLRSGAYLAHDDGFYAGISPLGATPRSEGGRLRSAMHGWVRVTSQPEPGLALVDAGKRDLPFDEGLPVVQLKRGTGSEGLGDVEVTALNDQHAFLRWDPATPSPVTIGDELRLGLSHPCTAFDKWGLVPVLDDADADDPVVVDLVRTFF